jgi:hypothetical protein
MDHACDAPRVLGGHIAMKPMRRPLVLALFTSAMTLALWAVLGVGANFGMHPVVAVAGLLWLATIGLPTSLGVALAAKVWGRFEPLTGLYGFLGLAVGLGSVFQVIAILALARVARAARALGNAMGWGQVLGGVVVVLALVGQAREAGAVLGTFRVVLLAQDCRYTEAGEPDWVNTSFYVPNEQLFRVVSRYPDLFIPCPSINPQRKDWEAELEYCLAQGARVLKIHPPTQAVNPGDLKFRAFYRKCAENEMRVMVHTGAEHAATIASKTLGDPRLLQLALEEGCTVIAAHAGTRAFFDPPAEDHFPDFVALAAKHPQLYADTAVLGSQFRWRCVPEIVRTPSVLSRIIHASDWPFPANALVFWHRLHPFITVQLMTERNLFLRDLRLKQALGMPVESFGRMAPVLAVDEPRSEP